MHFWLFLSLSLFSSLLNGAIEYTELGQYNESRVVCIVNWMRFDIRKRKLCRSPDCSQICTAIVSLEEFLKAAIGSNGNQFVFRKDCYSVTGDSNCKRAYGRAASSRSHKDPETSIGIPTLPTRACTSQFLVSHWKCSMQLIQPSIIFLARHIPIKLFEFFCCVILQL